MTFIHFLLHSYLIIADHYIYVLRPTDDDNKYIVKLRHKISSIMRITKKAKMPDVIKIEYGTSGMDGVRITDTNQLHIPKKAGKHHTYINKGVSRC